MTELTERFGDRIVFWGGGFVFAGIHNIQAGVPPANLLALFETFRECR